MISVTVHHLTTQDIAEGAYDPVFRNEANRQAEYLASRMKDLIKNLTCPNGHEPTGWVSITPNYERGPLVKKNGFCCEEMKALLSV